MTHFGVMYVLLLLLWHYKYIRLVMRVVFLLNVPISSWALFQKVILCYQTNCYIYKRLCTQQCKFIPSCIPMCRVLLQTKQSVTNFECFEWQFRKALKLLSEKSSLLAILNFVKLLDL